MVNFVHRHILTCLIILRGNCCAVCIIVLNIIRKALNNVSEVYLCVCITLHMCGFSCFQLFATLLSMKFSKQEYWNGLPFPPPGDLPNPGIKPESLASPVLAGRFFTNQHHVGRPISCHTQEQILSGLEGF